MLREVRSWGEGRVVKCTDSRCTVAFLVRITDSWSTMGSAKEEPEGEAQRASLEGEPLTAVDEDGADRCSADSCS